MLLIKRLLVNFGNSKGITEKPAKNFRLTILCTIFAIIIPSTVFAAPAPEADTDIFLFQPPQYISPGNPETGMDMLRINSIEVQTDPNVSAREFELRVYNKRGEVIYSVSEENTQGRGFFEELFDIGNLPGVEVPESLTWDGRDNNGRLVDDGEYFYQLYLRDSSQRRAFTAPLAVFVDTKAPEIIEIQTETTIISPNGDGQQDFINFDIHSGTAMKWTITIQSSNGSSVYSETIEAGGDTASSDIVAPTSFQWDGRNTAGQPQRDGQYRLVLTGIDRAGNRAEKSLEFLLSTITTDIRLSINNANPYFSFENRNSMTFNIELKTLEGINKWNLDILDADEIIYRQFSGTGEDLPSEIVFNGRGNPGRPVLDSRPLTDGEYSVIFTAKYANGNVSVSNRLAITIDNIAPQASVGADSSPIGRELADPIYFGGATKPTLKLEALYESEYDWDVVIIYEKERELSYPLSQYLSKDIRFPLYWDGINPLDGTEAPDGVYQVFLRAIDEAGNIGTSNIARFVKDTAERTGFDLEFSMPEPGIVRITPLVPITTGIQELTLALVNESNDRSYYARTERERLPYLDWFGRRNNSEDSPLGKYRAELDVLYLNGDRVQLRSSAIITLGANGPYLDSLLVGTDLNPQGRITLSDRYFSPDGDGVNDTVEIFLETSSPILEEWILVILDPSKNIFRQWQGEGLPPFQLEWDGRSESDELVQSAIDYEAILTLVDTEGRIGQASATIPVDILVITDGDDLRINIPSIYFAPNTADLFDVSDSEQEQNFRTLRRLETVLNRFPNYSIAVEGHAVWTRIGTPDAEAEQRDVLIPLSEARALEVKQALSILGVEWNRMTERGFGGLVPIVPHDDLENRWKNRRVEFILESRIEE